MRLHRIDGLGEGCALAVIMAALAEEIAMQEFAVLTDSPRPSPVH
jgi:hypothetical protein